jgi:hypothetical protein
MKLPKCEHCGKLMLGHLSVKSRLSGPHGMRPDTIIYEVVYFCPERIEPMDPIWVEVHDSSEKR